MADLRSPGGHHPLSRQHQPLIFIKGFGFSTLVTTLMQVPYGIFVSLNILTCVFLNDRFTNKRCLFMLIFLIPNISGTFGLRFVPLDQKVGRYICYLLLVRYQLLC